MKKHILPLSAIADAVYEAVEVYFDRQLLTVRAEITDVKKYPQKKWCFLKFLEKKGDAIITELKGVFWNNGYGSIAKFEQQTGQKFTDGLEVICDVMVKFHPKFGLSLEVIDIDTAHTIGQLELARQRTIEKLVADSGSVRQLEDGTLVSFNQSLNLPTVVKRIALIAPPNSDGLRDFLQELQHNNYGYTYDVAIFPTQVQGDAAIQQLFQTIQKISQQSSLYQALAIVRGGGSNTDFKPFDNYDVCSAIAAYPIPVLTGIGHDRNTSIADMVAHQLKTPTKVAQYFVENNRLFEERMDELYQRLMLAIHRKLAALKEELKYIDKTLVQLHPQNVLNKGYALLKDGNEIIMDVDAIAIGAIITIETKEHYLDVVVKEKRSK